MTVTFEEKIRNLEFYVLDRQIGLAQILCKHFEDKDDVTPFKQSGYVILSIATAYFEMIQQFIEGQNSDGQSKKFFIKGFKSVYSNPHWTDPNIEKIYKIVRCGMYHGGMPKIRCHLSRYFKTGFHLCGDEIHVNPAAVVREIRGHFERYIRSLRTEEGYRANFETMCDIMGLGQSPPDHTYCITPDGTVYVPTTPAPAAPGQEPRGWKVETER